MEELITADDTKSAEDTQAFAQYRTGAFTATPLDETVIRNAARGDEQAFETLFMGTYRYVFATVKKYLRNDQDAYDAIQETFSRVYKGLPRLESVSSFYPWLHRIAENCAVDILRLNGRDIPLPSDEAVADEAATERMQQAEVSADITDVLKQMPTEQVELLVRVYYDKMRVAEIARMQGVPVTTLHNRLIAAKKKLKELLKIRGIEKPIYSGEVITMISVALRNAIGTELLSMAVAEEILHTVIHSQNPKGAALISRFARRERSRAALKIASLLLAACLLVSGVTLLTVGLVGRSFFGGEAVNSAPAENGTTETSTATTGDTSTQSTTGSTAPVSTAKPTSGTTAAPTKSTTGKTTKAPVFVGALETSEVFGTLTEDGQLGIATTGDTVYATDARYLISAKKDVGQLGRIWITNFGEIYGDIGCFLNVFEERVYWINQDADSHWVLNRCDLIGSNHHVQVLGSARLTDLLVARDGVYYLADSTLYRADHDFTVTDRMSGVTDYAIVGDMLYYLDGSGILHRVERNTLRQPTKVSPDNLPYGSLHATGDILVLGQYNACQNTAFTPCNRLTVIDTATGKVVRSVVGGDGAVIEVKDVSPLDGGTVIYYHNEVLRTLNMTTGEIRDMSTPCGTVYGSHKYFKKHKEFRMSDLDGGTTYSFH